MNLPFLRTQADRFVDAHGRQVILRGLNLGGDSKVPFPDGGTQHPTDFANHRDVSFIGRPFPLADAHAHFSRIRAWGFNCLRLLTTWEAVEHAGPGRYDTAYLDYFAEICRRAGEHGLYVFIDFHQDVWSRMSGGDGAPGWTFEAVGLDFSRFAAADAAHVMQQRFDYASDQDVQASYPAMSWGQNYRMPANAIMWTLFWASKQFTPRFLIEGVPVSDYLQNHLLGAMAQVAQRVAHMSHVIGFDSLNEPGLGWLGQTLSPVLQADGKRQPSGLPVPGLTWSALDALAAAAGLPVELPLRGSSFDPQAGAVAWQVANPKGVRIWREGVRCPFEQAGIYAIETASEGPGAPSPAARALKEDVFTRFNERPLDIANDIFGPFYHRVAQTLRTPGVGAPHWLLFAEMDPIGAMTGRTFPSDMPTQSVNASHWYDVTLLVRKQFDPTLSVDLLTGERAEGEAAISGRYQRQLAHIQALSRSVVVGHTLPTLIGEFGIPYDLHEGAAYAAWAAGQRDAAIWQTHALALSLMYDAMDALHLSSTQWNYTAGNQNNARIGDQWNQEDLSVYSLDQPEGRAVHGFCRPYAPAVQGRLKQVAFSMETGEFSLAYSANPTIQPPTQIYLPRVQYPDGVRFLLGGPVLRHAYNEATQLLEVWAADTGTVTLVCSRAQSDGPAESAAVKVAAGE
jgi:hypothetical protein